MSDARREFLSGVRTASPLLVGAMPFGFIYGLLARSAGMDALSTQAMSLFVFAGSAQFIAVGLIAEGTSALLLITTTAIVNWRHMLYSATLAPRVKHLSQRWRIPLAYLLTDEAFAIAAMHYQDESRSTYKHWYFLGAGLTIWLPWQLSTASGNVLFSLVSAGGNDAVGQGSLLNQLNLGFTLPIMFIALLIPPLWKSIKQDDDLSLLAATLAAGIVGMLGAGLANRLGLLLAVVAGVGAGLIVESRASTRRQHVSDHERPTHDLDREAGDKLG